MSNLTDNKNIAKFMGYEVSKDLNYHKDLKYHKDWNWIMPVVEKIENLGFEVRIQFDFCIITNGDNYRKETDFGGGKLITTYTAIVDFINWYNNK